MGAWIEILISTSINSFNKVAPHMGAWIEIDLFARLPATSSSHPTWVRGLKYHLKHV